MSENRFGEYEKFVMPHWNDQELKNLETVVGFMQTVKGGDLDKLSSNYGDHPYIQHNPTMENGVSGVIKEVQNVGKSAPEFNVDTKHVYVDNEFVIFQAHFTALAAHRGDDSKGFNAIDIWRVVDGKIVEHWDSIQPLKEVIPANANGIF